MGCVTRAGEQFSWLGGFPWLCCSSHKWAELKCCGAGAVRLQHEGNPSLHWHHLAAQGISLSLVEEMGEGFQESCLAHSPTQRCRQLLACSGKVEVTALVMLPVQGN